MSAFIAADEISHEIALVRLEDVEELDYVRQSLNRLPTRCGKPAYHRDGRMAGYAQLGPRAELSRTSGTFVKGHKTGRSKEDPARRVHTP